MNGSDLKKWMKQNNKSARYVAGILNIDLRTVTRILEDKPVQQCTMAALERLAAETPEPQKKVG